MSLLDGHAALVVRADQLAPGDILQRRYRWRIQSVRVFSAIPRSAPGTYPFYPGRPARVVVCAHHEDRGEQGRTDTLEFDPATLLRIQR